MNLTLESLRPRAPRTTLAPRTVTQWELGAMARRRLGGGLMIDTTGDLFDRRCAANPVLATETPKGRD